MLKRLRYKHVLERYKAFLCRYFPCPFVNTTCSTVRKVSQELNIKFMHLLLCDYLLFWPYKKEQRFVVALYKKVITKMRELRSKKAKTSDILLMDRVTIADIVKRNSVMFLPYKKFGHSAIDFKQYLEYYIIFRQLKDDLTDYKSDKKTGKVTYTTVHGIKQTQKQIHLIYRKIQKLRVPLFYKNLIKFYIEV